MDIDGGRTLPRCWRALPSPRVSLRCSSLCGAFHEYYHEPSVVLAVSLSIKKCHWVLSCIISKIIIPRYSKSLSFLSLTYIWYIGITVISSRISSWLDDRALPRIGSTLTTWGIPCQAGLSWASLELCKRVPETEPVWTQTEWTALRQGVGRFDWNHSHKYWTIKKIRVTSLCWIATWFFVVTQKRAPPHRRAIQPRQRNRREPLCDTSGGMMFETASSGPQKSHWLMIDVWYYPLVNKHNWLLNMAIYSWFTH